MSKLISILDLDSLLHIVAAVQFGSGNKDNPMKVKDHVHRFISTICKNSGSEEVILLYQTKGHKNFRNVILPEYKGHRTPSDQIIKWKDTIIEAFREAGGYALHHIETDDAMSILAELIGYDKVLLITGDKDMQQVPTSFYNPFKPNQKWEDRWGSADKFQANAFLWYQILTGDPTDMPSSLCGVEGVGMKTAVKLCDGDDPFGVTVQNVYNKKYGEAGFARANLTYKMVRLLRLSDLEESYACEDAIEESKLLVSRVESLKIPIRDEIAALFEKTTPKPEDLFK